MAVEVTMPQMGADMTEGTVVKWLKQVGDQVTRGDIIAEIETDKANVELEAFESGVLKQIVIPEGETVPVGEPIAILGGEDEVVEGEKPRPTAAATPPRRTVDRSEEAPPAEAAETAAEAERGVPAGAAPERTPPREAAPAAQQAEPERRPAMAPRSHNGHADTRAPETHEGRLRISPVARRIAQEAQVDVSRISGSGPDGRILRRDVEALIGRGGETAQRAAPAAAPPPPPAQAAPPPRPEAPAPPRAEAPRPAPAPASGTVALSRMRQAIARRMAASKQTQPHYYLTLDIDMTAALTFREQVNSAASEQQHISINDLIVKACALALERHPKFNAEYTDAGLKMHDQIDIDIGIALDEGLIAPAILDCGHKSLGHIAADAKGLVERAKSGHLRAEEYGTGTFTITNLGAYGVETLIGIINPPQAAILGVGSVMPQPVVRDGQVVVRQVMKVALSADHRVSDGAEGARFIKEIQGLLENPVSLAL